jgi:carbon storage regulator
MLVLSRKKEESIIIGDNIAVTVVDIRGNTVRLGITAPIEVTVHRQETYETIRRIELDSKIKEWKGQNGLSGLNESKVDRAG